MSQNSTTIFFCFLIPSTISSSGTLLTRNPNQKPLMTPWNSIGDYWLLTAPDFPPRNIWTAKKANHTKESNKSFDTGKLHCGISFEFPSKGSLPWLCPTWGLCVRLNEFWREVLEFSLFSTSSEATSPSSRTHPVCQLTVWGPQVASFRSNKIIAGKATHALKQSFGGPRWKSFGLDTRQTLRILVSRLSTIQGQKFYFVCSLHIDGTNFFYSQ